MAAMINRIKSLFFGAHEAAPTAAGADNPVQLAAAALLVEAAWMDENFDANERARIEQLVRGRFGLGQEEARTLVDAAEAKVRDATQLLPFTRIIKDRFSQEERVEMLEMLWEVVYADGVLHDYEATLMRQIGALVYVPDRERGEARKRALAKLKAAPH